MEDKYKTPAGNIYNESELREMYPNDFDNLVSQGIFTKEDETIIQSETDDSVVDVQETVSTQIEEPTAPTGSMTGTLDLNPEDPEAIKKLIANTKTLASNITRIPLLALEASVPIIGLVDPEFEKSYNKLSPENREKVLTTAASTSGGTVGIAAPLNKISKNLQQEADQIQETIKQFETGIGEDLISLKPAQIAQGVGRLVDEVVGAIPSLVLAFAPGGLALIAGGTAAGKSRELQQKGKDLNFQTLANAAGSGLAEAIFERFTRKLGLETFKKLKGVPKEKALTTIKDIYRSALKGLGVEGSSETLTLLSQKSLDALLSDDARAFENIFQESFDTFLVGGAVGAPLSGLGPGVRRVIQNKQKSNINKIIDESKYNSLVEAFEIEKGNKTIDLSQVEVIKSPNSKIIIEATVDGLVKKNKLTQSEANTLLDNFNNLSDRVVRQDNIKDNFLQAYPDISEQDLNELVPLQEELTELQNNPVDTQVKEQEVTQKINNITNKYTTDAIQESSAEEIPLPQPPQDSGSVREGDAEGTEIAGEVTLENQIDETTEPNQEVEVETEVTETQVIEPTTVEQVKETLITEATEKIRNPQNDASVRKKAFTDLINQSQKQGKISSKVANSLIKQTANLNFKNPVVVEKLVNKTTKVFEKAADQKKLTDAELLRKQIAKQTKDPSGRLDVTVKDSAKGFLKIDPYDVSDVQEYLDVGKNLLDGLKPTTKKSIQEGRVAPAVDVKATDEYNAKEIDLINKQNAQLEQDAFEFLTGTPASELNLKEVRDILYDESRDAVGTEQAINQQIKNKIQDKAKIVKDATKKAFDLYAGIVDNQLKTGRDIFNTDPETGEGQKISLTPKQKQTAKRFLEMDLNLLTEVESLRALDALVNFATNSNTSGMAKTVSNYAGRLNLKKAIKDGLTAQKLSTIAQEWGKNIATFGLFTEFMFNGRQNTTKILKLSGLSDLFFNTSKSEKTARDIKDDFVKEFKKSKPNNEAFNTEFNIVARGMLGFVRRTIDGTEASQAQEFKRTKKLIEDSFKKLKNQNSQTLKQKGQVYEDVYNKILKDANNINEVESKVDPQNLEAVEWVTNKWSEYYDDLLEVNQGVYNKGLDKDINYTTHVYSVLPDTKKDLGEIGDPILEDNNTRAKIYDKETGVLKPITRPSGLGENQYVDLNFDNKQMKSLEKAIMDINTAESIQQVKGFFESPEVNQLIETKSDRDLMTDRIKEFVARKRGIEFTDPRTQKLAKGVNRLAAFAVGRVLGSFGQVIKQTAPVANTLVTVGAENTLSGINTFVTSKDARDWLKNSGYAIALRGIGSEAQIDSLNNQLEKAAESAPAKTLKVLDKLQTFYLKGLIASDKFTANTSWLGFYFKSLKEQGVDPSSIDWKTHEVNRKAGDYAQQMVDRQQNISDRDLAGKIYGSKSPGTRIFTQMVAPFSNFLFNLKTRLYSDVNTAFNKTSSKEAKSEALKSLGGLAAETALFNTFRILTLYGLTDAARSLLPGAEEESKEKKERSFSNRLKGIRTNVISDLVNPLSGTPADDLFLPAVNNMYKFLFDSNKNLVYDPNESRNLFDILGTFGIGAERVSLLIEYANLYRTGKFEKESFGTKKEYKLTKEQINQIKDNGKLYILYLFGALPSEVGFAVERNIKNIKDAASKSKKKPTLKEIERIKRTNPKLWEKQYGPNSLYAREKERERQRRKRRN